MGGSTTGNAEKPREWRRRVLVPARMRSAAGWGDARILNISSRGLMVHVAQLIEPGCMIELRRGDQRIVATVVWREGRRAGLQSDTVLPIADLLCMSESLPVDATTEPPTDHSRHKLRRDEDFYRWKARAIEFASVTAIASAIAIALSSLAVNFLGTQIALISAALAA